MQRAGVKSVNVQPDCVNEKRAGVLSVLCGKVKFAV